jgi:hypothetical protein
MFDVIVVFVSAWRSRMRVLVSFSLAISATAEMSAANEIDGTSTRIINIRLFVIFLVFMLTPFLILIAIILPIQIIIICFYYNKNIN